MSDRITKRNSTVYTFESLTPEMNEYLKNVQIKLKQYEDIEPSVDRVRELNEFYDRCGVDDIGLDRMLEFAQAEREERLKVMPCKVGDKLYGVFRTDTVRPFVKRLFFNESHAWQILFSGEFGKTIFMTKEEADKALEYFKENPTEPTEDRLRRRELAELEWDDNVSHRRCSRE
jgi:peroxiredoxin family protein